MRARKRFYFGSMFAVVGIAISGVGCGQREQQESAKTALPPPIHASAAASTAAMLQGGGLHPGVEA